MSKDQMMGLVRQALPFVGGILVARGYLTAKDLTLVVDGITQLADIATKAAAPVATLVGVYLSIRANRPASIMASAAKIEDVTVQVKPTTEGLALAKEAATIAAPDAVSSIQVTR